MRSLRCVFGALIILALLLCGLYVMRTLQEVIPDQGKHDRMISVKGINYHYLEYQGEGQDVLLLHGFGASTYTWEEMAPMVAAEDYHVFALDIKGFGWSDKPLDSEYSILALTENVNDWMEAMNLTQVVVVGNSMGGSITTVLSKLHPERVSSMVLIDAGGYPMDIPLPIKLARLPMAPFFNKLLFCHWTLKNNLKEVMYDKSKVTHEMVDAYYQRMITKNALDVQIKVARTLDFTKKSDVRDATVGNTTKTLIIWGQNDPWIPLDTVGYNFRKDLENSILYVIPECGHIPQEEKPDAVSSLVLDFLNDRPITDHAPG